MTCRGVTSGEARRRVQWKRDAILFVLLSSLTSFALLLLAFRSGVGHWSAGGSSIRIVSEQPEKSVGSEKPKRFENYRLPSRPSKLESQRTRMIEALADWIASQGSGPVD